MQAFSIVFLVLIPAASSMTAGLAATTAPRVTPATGETRLAGLWDKPSQACMRQCRTMVKSGCFREMAEKHPAADAASLQDRCEDKFSVCLYQCMCENCKHEEKKTAN